MTVNMVDFDGHATRFKVELRSVSFVPKFMS